MDVIKKDCDRCKGTGYSYIEIISHGRCDYESKTPCGKCNNTGVIELVEYKEIQRLKEENERLKDEYNQVIKTFSHTHVNNGINDFCEECGLYLTHPVHIRSTKGQ